MTPTRSTLSACLAATLSLGVATATIVVTAPAAQAKSDKAQSDKGKGGSDRARGGKSGDRKATRQASRGKSGTDLRRGGSKSTNWATRRAEKAGAAIDGALGRLTGRDKAQAKRDVRRGTTTTAATTATTTATLAPEATVVPEARKKPNHGAIKAMHAVNASPNAFRNASDNSRVGRIRTWATAYYAAEDARAELEAEREQVYGEIFDGMPEEDLAAFEAALAAGDPTSETYYDDALATAFPDWSDDDRGTLAGELAEADAYMAEREVEVAEYDTATTDALIAAAGPNAAPEGEDLDWVIERMPSRETLGLPAPAGDTTGDEVVEDDLPEEDLPGGDLPGDEIADEDEPDLGTPPIEGIVLVEE